MMRPPAMLMLLIAVLSACSGRDQDAPGPAAASAPPPAAPAPRVGQRVFEHWCLPCHAAGAGHPGTNRLAERLGRDQSVILERTDLDAGHVKTVVRDGFQMMPPFRYTEISDPELDAVARYVASHGEAHAQ